MEDVKGHFFGNYLRHEVREEVSKPRVGKAVGICGIFSELLKAGTEPMAWDLDDVLAAITEAIHCSVYHVRFSLTSF